MFLKILVNIISHFTLLFNIIYNLLYINFVTKTAICANRIATLCAIVLCKMALFIKYYAICRYAGKNYAGCRHVPSVSELTKYQSVCMLLRY